MGRRHQTRNLVQLTNVCYKNDSNTSHLKQFLNKCQMLQYFALADYVMSHAIPGHETVGNLGLFKTYQITMQHRKAYDTIDIFDKSWQDET